MCLVSSHLFPKRAKEPITVLKLVIKDRHIEDTYHPSYVYTSDIIYELGKRQKAHSRSLISWIIFRNIFRRRIESGFIHSVIFPEKGREFSNSIKKIINICIHEGSYVLLKCIIPKDTLYYKNSDGSYASREIIPIKDITSELLCQKIIM